MAQDQTIVAVSTDTWTQITNADVTNITFEVVSGAVYIRYTTDTTTPTEDYGFIYKEAEGEQNVALSTLVNLSGADRVWAKAADTVSGRLNTAAILVDHA